MASQRAHYNHLRDRWTQQHATLHGRLWEKHKEALEWLQKKSQHAAVGSLGAFMLFALPGKQEFTMPKMLSQNVSQEVGNSVDKKVFVINDLSKILPDTVEPLNESQEKQIANVMARYYGVNATAELDGKRLNRSYGYIGAEQHLMRFEGDTMEGHFDNQDDATKYYSSGMAPGRGAWGYFGTDNTATQREKYYIAVQSFLSPGWQGNSKEMYQFFKYRKMLVVNPQNGKAMVVVIGDAGPAAWTGKHLGGSPEVMKYLERVDGRQKGPVLYFFLDDPDDKIPLGPLPVSETDV
ncbi:MAG: hypothetical protein KBD46_01025 [Candidatus Levybacteria bacterium]|nr:hypothetical protein [Candidatus Levybacteria bacterium]